MSQPKRPNILLITTDEERFPPPYENKEAATYREKNAKTLAAMRARGIDFKNHHAAATACAPSRTTIYTGQYPSLHGVSQTPGVGKSSFDQNMYWLKPNTVPTMGNYFRAAGYQTWYHGKWHISYEDIDIPGTQTALLSNSTEGKPYPDRIRLYEEANNLDKYGFNGWIGPEPHGKEMANNGSVRDPGFARQASRTIERLDARARAGEELEPFLMVASFVNPHDIVFADLYKNFPAFGAAKDAGRLPEVTPAPTTNESLESKPRCQKDYVYTYPRMYIPQPNTEDYRRFYYFLMAEVDKHIHKVYKTLMDSSFAENTYVIYTSDHGEMLGAHGGMQQKWYSAYNEILNVPFVISNPGRFSEPRQTEAVTSHVDLLPTLLGLAGIDAEDVRKQLKSNHSEARKLVGRNLADAVTGESCFPDDPIYFMTDDNVEVGMQARTTQVIQPKHLETVVTKLPNTGDVLWKYTHYFDNPRFYAGNVGNPDNIQTQKAIPSEYECYNLQEDPLETDNLLSPLRKPPLNEEIKTALEQALEQQRKEKRLLPHTLNQEENRPKTPLLS